MFTPSLSTTLSIIDAASNVLVKNDTVKNSISTIARASIKSDRIGSAITGLSKQTTILSRAFVDESVLNEPILPNLFRSFHEWYTAQVISALHLSQMVDSHRTVQDVMSVVQTGHNERENSLVSNIINRRIGQESFLTNYLGEAACESMMGPSIYDIADDKKYKRVRDQIKDAQDVSDRSQRAQKEHEEETRRRATRETSVKSVKVGENRVGPMGELYEVKLSNPNGNGAPVTIPVFIQMQPSIVDATVAPRFIDMNVDPTMWQRWTQMRAGEINFWKDFLLQRDLIKRGKSVLKDPVKANAFSDFLKTVAKKDFYALGDATDTLGARHSSNLSNSVMVFSEDTVLQAKADSGIDLHKESDRQRYFKNTYTMIIAIIDPLHQRVTVYFNGIDGDINCSYNEFRPKDTKFDPKDFMTALSAFSTNNISRLR